MGVNKKRWFVLMLAVIMIISTIPMGFANGATLYYVDSVGGDDANDGSSGAPFATLSHAISQVTEVSGSYEIHLAAGAYAGVGLVALPAGVTLRILGQGASTVVYKPAAGAKVLEIRSRNVVYLSFENMVLRADDPTTLDVESGGYGIHVYDNDLGGSSMNVESCELDGFQFGVYQEYSDGFTVNVIDSQINGMRPVHMENGLALNVTNSQLHMSTGEWYDPAIYLGGSGTVTVTGSTIIGNDGVGRGIYGGYGAAIISQNTFKDLSIAVELGDFGRLDLIENTVNTTADGFDVEQYVNGAGIVIADNTLVKSGYWKNGDVGIEIDVDDSVGAANIQVTGNTIANYHLAFDLATDDDNTVSFDFSGNVFRNNYKNLELSTYMATPFNFELNDWGTDDLDEIRAKAYSSRGATIDVFDFEPIVPTAAPAVVTVGSDPADDYETIQEGTIWVANGGTVNIGNGVYTGPIWVGRPMSLVGVGDSVVVNTHPTLAFVQETALFASADVVLENLTFSGGVHAIYMGEVSGVDPGDLTVTDCVFEDFTNSNIYYVVHSPDVVSEIIVQDSTFDRDADGGYAMMLQNTMSDVRIEGNSITDGFSQFSYVNARDVTLVDNDVSTIWGFGMSSVYVNAGGEVIIDGNSFVAPPGIPSNYGFYGLSVYLPDVGVDVSSDGIHHVIRDNTISGFNTGLFLGGTQTADSYTVVVGGSEADANDFSGNMIGLMSNFTPFGADPVDATYNIWGVEEASIGSYIWVASTQPGYGPVTYLPMLVADVPAALTALSVTPLGGGAALVLTPTFDGAVTAYSASVAHGVSQVTIAATANKGDLRLDYGLVSGAALPALVPVSVGANVFEVVLEHNSVETTYTVTVTRAAAPVVVDPGDSDDDGDSGEPAVFTPVGSGGSRITSSMVGAAASGDYVYTDEDSDETLDVVIEGPALASLAERGGSRLSLDAPVAQVSFDARAIETIVRDFGSDGDYTFTATRLKPVSGRPVYAFSLKQGDDAVTHFKGGTVTVRVPYTLGAGENPSSILVYHVSEDGVRRLVRGFYEDGFVMMQLKHFSVFEVGYREVAFTDVAAGDPHEEAIGFLASRGIMNGYADGSFKADRAITRAQLMMVIMKAFEVDWSNMSDEAVEGMALALDGSLIPNFVDAGETYYSKALWVARIIGLANGRGGGRFDPNATVTGNEAYLMMRNAIRVLEPERLGDAGLFGAEGVLSTYDGDLTLLGRGDAAELVSRWGQSF